MPTCTRTLIAPCLPLVASADHRSPVALGTFLTQEEDGGEGEGEGEREASPRGEEGPESEEDDLARLERIDERLRELRASRPVAAEAGGCYLAEAAEVARTDGN